MSSKVFRTPMSNRTEFSGQASSSSSRSVQKSYDDVQNEIDGNSEDGGGTARVYWYAPPSPSLQVQQAEHQRIMARAGAIQPMASQAFRDELLGPFKVHDTETNVRSRKVGRRSARRSNATSISAHSGNSESFNKGKNTRDTGAIDQILDDLDEHLMNRKVDLMTEEETNHEQVIAKDAVIVASQDGSQVDIDTDNLQKVLIEGMDRAFSQDKDNYIIASTLPLLSRNTKNWSRTASMPVQRSSQSDTHSIKDPLIALPIQEDEVLLGKRSFPYSPQSIPQAHGRRSSIDAMDVSPCKSNCRPLRSSPNKRRAAESIDPLPLQERDSNIDRTNAKTILPQVKVRKGHFSRSVSEGVKRMNPIERLEVGTMTSDNDAKVMEESDDEPKSPILTQGKSKSGSNSPQTRKMNDSTERRSPSAHRQRTVPRCGLSRSAAPSSSRQHQMMNDNCSMFTTSAFSSTAGRKASINAPFKQPMRRSPRKKEGQNQKPQNSVESRSISRSTSGTSDVITIDDSSDDETGEKQCYSTGKERMAPIKASPSARETIANKSKSTLPKSTEAVASTTVGEISFDTSLDDETLCDALDQIEASQKVQVEQTTDVTNDSNKISQSAPAHPTSDDSFENMIDDDVSAAILIRMDEEGW